MEARKENKVYQIDPREADYYAAQGYDLYDGLKLVKHAANKSVPIEIYEQALAEIERLEKDLAKAKKAKKTEEGE